MDWDSIWSLQTPERIRSFIWRVKHDRLITNLGRSKMNLKEPYCCECSDVIKSTFHVLGGCTTTKSV